MAALDKNFPTLDCSICIEAPKLSEVEQHPNIELLTLAEVQAVTGEAGSFRVDVRQAPRYIDLERCIACGVCAERCSRRLADEFNAGLGARKSAYLKYPQAVPLKYAIDGKSCIALTKGKGKCRACEKFCPAGAVRLDDRGRDVSLSVGAVVLAPGFRPFDPSRLEPYLYRRHPNVVTSLEFERILSASGPYRGHLVRPSDQREPRKIAWIQCVGSRGVEHGYCSGVCCMYAVKEAVTANEHVSAGLKTTIFFMDMRAFDKDFEQYWRRAERDHGVRFVRSRVHTVHPVAEGDMLSIDYSTEQGAVVEETFDLVVLSTGIEVPADAVSLAEKLGIQLDSRHFVLSRDFLPVDLAALDATLAQALKDWGVPGMAVAIVKDGKVVFAKGYGVKELGKPDRVDEKTLFAIASNTKAFTAAAVGILVDEKKVDWDDRVTAHLPYLQLYDPYVTGDARVRDLMSHRSGLGPYSGDLLWYGTPCSREEVVRRARYLKPVGPFRARYGYQNVMFIAAGEVVTKASGLTGDTVMSIAVAPDGRICAAQNAGGLVELDAATMRVVRRITSRDGLVSEESWTPNAIAFASGGSLHASLNASMSVS